MLENIRWYLINVAAKKYVPVAVMAGMATLGTLYAAHSGALEQWGVNYITQFSLDWFKTHDISGPVILIELDTTNQAIIALVFGLIAMVSRAGQHHTTGEMGVAGGQRSSDPPAA